MYKFAFWPQTKLILTEFLFPGQQTAQADNVTNTATAKTTIWGKQQLHSNYVKDDIYMVSHSLTV